MTDYQFISADNHLDMLWLPRNLWTDRLPARFHERCPHVVETEAGTFWEWEGKARIVGEGRLPNTASADGHDGDRFLEQHYRSRGIEVRSGSLPPSDPEILLQHFDQARIYSGVFYGATRKWQIDDKELLVLVYQAYNDFALELCSADPDRILALPLLPTELPDAAIAELNRLAGQGLKAVEFGPFDVGVPIFDPIWEPLWAAAEEAGIAICSHIGDKAGALYPPNRYGESKAHFSLAPLTLLRPLAHFIFGGILERHPGLRLALGECNIGWVPYFLWCMDRQEREREPDPDVQLSMLPSEYFYRQVTVSFEEDVIGVGAILHEENPYLLKSAVWGADYPHNHVTWPDAPAATESLLKGASESTRRAILWDNAAAFWGIRGPGLEAVTPHSRS